MSTRRPSSTERGRLAESVAAAYLELCGYKILTRNVRVGALEIDLVALKDDLLVIVEVRLRRRASPAPQAAQAWVPPEKWRRLQQAARRLPIGTSNLPQHPRIRIDLILVTQMPFCLHVRHVAGCPRRRPAD